MKTDEIDKISSVACIVNLDEFKNIPALSGFAEVLGILPEKFNAIAYTKTPEKYKDIKYPICSIKDFNWKLKLKESGTKVFLDREYDLLINYFTREKRLLLLLSTLTRAKIRVGFGQLNDHYNDIIFKVHTANHDLFKEELLRYLKIMKKV